MAKFLFYDDKIINIMLQKEKPSGGAAVQAYGWIRGLAETGQDVRVLTNIEKIEELKDECKDISLVPLYNPQKGLKWVRWIYYRIPYIYQRLKAERPDYVYEGTLRWHSFIIALLCRHLGIRYMLRISNDFLVDERIYKNHSRMEHYFQKLGMKYASYILCQNDYQLAAIRKRFPKKLAIKITNPVFLKSRSEAIDKSKGYIAWLGLYQYQKNLGLLYKIARMMKDQKFLVAGKEGTNCDEETHYYLAKLKTLSNVSFIGFLERNEVIPFLAKARFLLNTSHYEGFSNTFLEAMAAGTPILTSCHVNPDNIISEHRLGLVYDDAHDLQKRLYAVTAEDYITMSNNVYQYVAQQHDYRILSKQLVNYLAEFN